MWPDFLLFRFFLDIVQCWSSKFLYFILPGGLLFCFDLINLSFLSRALKGVGNYKRRTFFLRTTPGLRVRIFPFSGLHPVSPKNSNFSTLSGSVSKDVRKLENVFSTVAFPTAPDRFEGPAVRSKPHRLFWRTFLCGVLFSPGARAEGSSCFFLTNRPFQW